MAQPVRGKILRAVRLDQRRDRELVSFRRGGGKGERDLAQTQLEQPVAARRLAIIVALLRCLAQSLDLAVVEAEAAVDRQYLWLERPLVGQEYPGGRESGASGKVGE